MAIIRAMDGTEWGEDEKPPPQEPEVNLTYAQSGEKVDLQEAFKQFEQGDFLGNALVHFTLNAVNVKDYKKFRAISMYEFGDDDWRAFKFMLRLYELWSELINLNKFTRLDKAKKQDGRKQTGKNCVGK